MLHDEVQRVFAGDGPQVRLVAADRERHADGRVAIALLPGDVATVQVADRNLVVHFLRRPQHRVGIADEARVRDHEDRQANAAHAYAPLVGQLDLGECPA